MSETDITQEAKQFNAALRRYKVAHSTWAQARKDEKEAHDEMWSLMPVLMEQGYKVTIPVRVTAP